LRLSSQYSLLQETFLRTTKVMAPEDIFVIGNEEQSCSISQQLCEIEPSFAKNHIIIEPEGRNTAPAMMLAVKTLTDVHGALLDEPILFLPADHYIGDTDAYATCLRTALAQVGDHLGTIGIAPTKPHTGYGYIQVGEKEGGHFLTKTFKEKPSAATAESYIASGSFYWNSGMYLFTARTFAAELKEHVPTLGSAFSENLSDFTEHFSTLPSISIDYALAEKSNKVVLFEGCFDWSDIGSFDRLAELHEKQGLVNHQTVQIDSHRVFTHSDTGRLIATVGVDDIVVVDSHDSILVQKRGCGEGVKKVVDHLKEQHRKEATQGAITYHAWGRHEMLIDTPSCTVKKMVVQPGGVLNLVSPPNRATHLIVAHGTGMMHGNTETILREHESLSLPVNAPARLSNPSQEPLELIEVQTGIHPNPATHEPAPEGVHD
jgi:mannose-1-phosphate guanylyltransferase/mannose-6-phosphate isomerase